MIQLQQVKIPVSQNNHDTFIEKCAKELHIEKKDILDVKIIKKSIDARKKPSIFFVYTFGITVRQNEEKLLKRFTKNVNITKYTKKVYQPKVEGKQPMVHPPIIIGAGPAGLFCAYLLALNGYAPIVLERGKKAQERLLDVVDFWTTGILNPSSNVQFGEGGAGTFSDGKLNTLVKDKEGRNHFVLETFVKFGAPGEILYDGKPHIGTDLLVKIVENMRNEIIRLGGSVRFESQVTDFSIENEKVCGIIVNDQETIPCETVILAIGHSARDTFEQLLYRNVLMHAKEFAMGFRIEHPQDMINEIQYGKQMGSQMSASAYKLATTFDNHRGVYSFCMCPGGYVVNASSEENRLVVNGMSYSKRDSGNANSAIVFSVGGMEYDMKDPLGAMKYQRKIEQKCFEIGSGKIPQQLLSDFKQDCISSGYGEFESKIKGNTTFANLREIYPNELNQTFLLGMEAFERKIHGFDRADAILSGVESRTSSPVRIERDACFESNIKGIYPCGEGAGYAGGITSAAMDGLKVAEAIMKKYTNL